MPPREVLNELIDGKRLIVECHGEQEYYVKVAGQYIQGDPFTTLTAARGYLEQNHGLPPKPKQE